MRDIIDQYNGILEGLSAAFGVPLVDMVASWWGDSSTTPDPFGGYSGAHPIQDQDNSTFSLDGVHPNNLGHALCARAFIEMLNAEYQLGIPSLTNLDPYKGQYSGKSIDGRSLPALQGMRRILGP